MTKAADQSRAWRQANPARVLWYDAKRRARKRGVPFELTVGDVQALLDQGWFCVYCDAPVGTFSAGTRPNSATLDRLLPQLGYTRRNTVLCCHQDNCTKGDHTPATLRAWADRIETVINRLNLNESECPTKPE